MKEEPLVIAEFETPHFTFVTLAPDRETAFAQLSAAWLKHAQGDKYVDPRYLERHARDVNCYDIRRGQVLRDGEVCWEEGK